VLAQAANARLFSMKQVLIPLLAHPRVAFVLKWTVYIWLVVNFIYYVQDDILAWRSAVPPGAPLGEIILQFATTIDTAAWLILIVVFELETYALPDIAFTKWLDRFFFAIKVLCYSAIAYAAYGYLTDTLELYELIPLGHLNDLCSLVGQGLTVQLDAALYEDITTASCTQLTANAEFHNIVGETVVISATELGAIRTMGWLDVENAVVWIIVVILIDMEVHLQNADKFASRRLNYVRLLKTVGYTFLIGNYLMWFVYGYALYTWDAFLWIFGFWAIELNLAEWEDERLEELEKQAAQAQG
jgi:hypothetical protein